MRKLSSILKQLNESINLDQDFLDNPNYKFT